MGAQQEDEGAGLQDGKPRPGGRVRDAAVRGEGGQVQKLAGASGAEADEALERSEIADPQDVAYVPLHVGPKVAPVPFAGVHLLVVDPWIHPPEQDPVDGSGRRRGGGRGRAAQEAVRLEWASPPQLGKG